MTDAPDNQNPQPTNAGDGAQSAQSAPQLSVLGQYVKDLSFENPSAPRIDPNVQPQLGLNLSVAVASFSEKDFEVTLKVRSEAKANEQTMFLLELDYAGVFRLENFPQDAVHPTLHVECPRILFPFARRLIADLTKEGGMPPLYIDPVDFGQLYMSHMRKVQEQQQQAPGGDAAPTIN